MDEERKQRKKAKLKWRYIEAEMRLSSEDFMWFLLVLALSRRNAGKLKATCEVEWVASDCAGARHKSEVEEACIQWCYHSTWRMIRASCFQLTLYGWWMGHMDVMKTKVKDVGNWVVYCVRSLRTGETCPRQQVFCLQLVCDGISIGCQLVSERFSMSSKSCESVPAINVQQQKVLV